MVSVRAVCTLSPECHDNQSHAFAQNSIRSLLVREPWVEPGQIVVTGLDDRGLRDDRVQAVAVLILGGEPDPDVGVEHDHTAAAFASHQVDEG